LAPYRPAPESPWDLRRVVHLYHWAGFAATGKELRRDLEAGPKASVERLLAGRTLPAGAAAEFERASAAIATASRRGGCSACCSAPIRSGRGGSPSEGPRRAGDGRSEKWWF
jgi:hypothetical protein